MSERNRLDELYRSATAGKADIDVDALARSVADGRPDPAALAESSDAALAWRIAREMEPEAGMLAAALGNAASPVVVPMRSRAPRWTWVAGAALAAGLATVAVYRPVVTERMPSAPDVASAVAPAVATDDRIMAGSSFEGDEPAARPGAEAPDGVLFNDDFDS